MLPPDTDKDNAWLNPDAYQKALVDMELAKQNGYIEVPNWFPVPLDGYDYKIFGQVFACMKPKPKLRHILRYKFQPRWWIRWKIRKIKPF